ncbi:MAG TPA: hypothetical protein VGN71_04530 [Solirubrobacteraceae bacterium]|jgi:hypothetical protein|nr:hypothetical protein [Solirubrobacteraceae bacterium]
MSIPITRARAAAALVVVGLGSGYAVAAASTPARHARAASAPPAITRVAATAPSPRAAATATPSRPVTKIDRLARTARQRYSIEVHGGVAFGTLHRIGRDPALLRTLRSGNLQATRAYVQQQFAAVWYHLHASRVRVLKGSRVVADAGVPFVVAPAHMTLRGPGGQALGTLEVSIQDEIGYVRYMHRNYHVEVVVRGRGAAHVRTSLPAAAQVTLPSRGPVTIAGQKYLVRSFHETALGGEPVTVSILLKG